MGRVVYAAALDGNLPRFLGKVDPKTGVPRRALITLFVLIMAALVVYYFMDVDIQSAFLATSGAAILTYVVGSASGIRLLTTGGLRRALPWVSLIISLAILPFIGTLLVATVPVAVLGFIYGSYRKNRSPTRAQVSP